MISTRSNLKKLGIISGLLMFALVAIFCAGRNSQGVSILYMGMREQDPFGRYSLFMITNPLPYRVNWINLAPEFELQSGWTTTELLRLYNGGRIRPGNPEPLKPGRSYDILGPPATNVPFRIPVVWEMCSLDAKRRPKWKRVADDWAERMGLRPFFLPHGILYSPVILPASLNKIAGANADEIDKLKVVGEGFEEATLSRRLTIEESSALRHSIKTVPKLPVRFVCPQGDTAAEAYLGELASVFRSEKFPVERCDTPAWLAPFMHGVYIFVHSQETAPAHAEGVIDAFGRAGVQVISAGNNKCEPNTLTIVLGYTRRIQGSQ